MRYSHDRVESMGIRVEDGYSEFVGPRSGFDASWRLTWSPDTHCRLFGGRKIVSAGPSSSSAFWLAYGEPNLVRPMRSFIIKV